MCAAIACSWEEEQQEDGALENDNQRSSGVGLASVLSVFDTLAEACFTSFGDGDAGTLSQALRAAWAADGALRRVSAAIATITTITTQAAAPPGGGAEEGDGAVPTSDAGSGSGEARSSGYGASVEWVEDSRMVGIVRSLAQWYSGPPADGDTRAGQQAVTGSDDGGGGGGDGDGRSGDTSGNGGGSSTEGVRESMASEEAGGRTALPVGALSLVELAGAVLDAVGPEATGEVLAACPQLLNCMPPKVCGVFCVLCEPGNLCCHETVTVGVVSCGVLRGRVSSCPDRLGWEARGLCVFLLSFPLSAFLRKNIPRMHTAV